MSERLRVAVIGFGQISGGYAEDVAMARYYRYATHVQVLAAHPAFTLVAAVDPAAAARARARAIWNVPHVVETPAALGAIAETIEVAVLATPPEARLGVLERLPALRAVLVEKPLGRSLADSAALLRHCADRGICVQVNMWRRADDVFRRLAEGHLAELIGPAQCAFGVYGNGLLNNGTHMIDFVRMLLGEIVAVSASAPETAFTAGPIMNDMNVTCSLQLASGKVVTLSPLRFEHYRENGLEIWGETGRVAIYNEGLSLARYELTDNRAMTGEREVAFDHPVYMGSTVGDALYHMFTNVAAALRDGAELYSPGESALVTAGVIEAIFRSAEDHRPVPIGDIAERYPSAFRQ